jgi:hypothetical protein
LVRFGTESADHRGLIENLSGSGLYLTSAQVFPPQTKIRIEFTIDKSPGVLEGVVQWARRVPSTLTPVLPSGMGIRLMSAPEPYQRLLAELTRRFAR